MDGIRTQFTLLEGRLIDAKAISDQDQIVVVHCHCYRRSKYTRSQLLSLKLPGLDRASLEFNRSAGGNVTVTGEANVQQGAWNKDAAIPIVSRCRQSEAESSTVPERTGTWRSRLNLPSHCREGGYIEFDTGSGLVCSTERFRVNDALDHPGAVSFLYSDPLWRGIRIRWREGRLRVPPGIIPSDCSLG